MKRYQAAFGMLGLVALSAALASPAASAAPVFRWTDDNGQVHLTDDPNQVPRRARPRALPSARSEEPSEASRRPAAQQTLEALATLESAARSGVPFQDYLARLADARSVFEVNLPYLVGPARYALMAAMACHTNAADAWRVWNASRAAWTQRRIQRAWACGTGKVAEARQYLAGGEEPPRTFDAGLTVER